MAQNDRKQPRTPHMKRPGNGQPLEKVGAQSAGKPIRPKRPAPRPKPPASHPAKIASKKTRPPRQPRVPKPNRQKTEMRAETKSGAADTKPKNSAHSPAPPNPAKQNPAAGCPKQAAAKRHHKQPNPPPTKKEAVKPGAPPDPRKSFRENWQAWKKLAIFKPALVVIGLICGLSLLAFLPAFHLTKIAESELYFNDPEAILKASGLQKNQHFLQGFGGSLHGILTARYEAAEQKVWQQFPQLKSVKLSFAFPGELRMDIEERIPVAFMDVNDLFVTLDRFGVVCGSYPEVPEGLPAIKGINAVQMQVGEKIKTNADEALDACVAVMSAIVEADFESQGSEPLLTRLSEIRSSGYQRILLRLKANSAGEVLQLSCNDNSDLTKDFLWVKRILDSKVLDNKLPGTLDVYGTKLVFRPQRKPTQQQEEVTYVWADPVPEPEPDEISEEAEEWDVSQE